MTEQPEAARLAAELAEAVGGPPDPETPESGERHAIGQVIREAETVLLQQYPDAKELARVLLVICAPWTGGLRMPGSAYRLITDTAGTRHLVDGGGVRYFTEEQPRLWEIAVAGGNWAAWQAIAESLRQTPEPGAQEGSDKEGPRDD